MGRTLEMSDSQASAMEKPENVNAVSKHTHKQTKNQPHKNSGTPVSDKSSRQPPLRKGQRPLWKLLRIDSVISVNLY